MGLDKIVTKILADSKAKEQSIISDAHKQSEELMADAMRQKAELLDSYQKRAEQAIAQMKVREGAGMEIEVKKKLLSTRREILEDTFDSVLEHFMNLPESEKRKLYSAMMTRLKVEFQGGKIHCRRGEEGLFPAMPGFTMVEPVETMGGFIAESNDGSLMVDMRFEALLKEIWDSHLVEISGILFPDGESP